MDCFLRLLFALWHCLLGASFGPAHRDLGLLHLVHLELGAAGHSGPPYLPSSRWVCPIGALAMFPTSSAVCSSFPRELLCFLHVVEDGPVFLVHPGCLLLVLLGDCSLECSDPEDRNSCVTVTSFGTPSAQVVALILGELQCCATTRHEGSA